MGSPLRSVSLEKPVRRLFDRQLLALVIRDEDVDDVRPVRDWVAELLRHPAGDGRRNVTHESLEAAVRPHLGRDGIRVVVPHLALKVLQGGD